MDHQMGIAVRITMAPVIKEETILRLVDCKFGLIIRTVNLGGLK